MSRMGNGWADVQQRKISENKDRTVPRKLPPDSSFSRLYSKNYATLTHAFVQEGLWKKKKKLPVLKRKEIWDETKFDCVGLDDVEWMQ